MDVLKKLYRRTFSVVITALFGGFVVITFAQVVFRYVIGYSLYWSEELARYLFVWVSFLGSVVALERGVHIGMDVVIAKLPPGPRRYVEVFSDISVAAFLVFLTVQGLQMAMRNMIQKSPALQVSIGAVSLAIPVGAALMGIYVIGRLVSRLCGPARTSHPKEPTSLEHVIE
jgi:TRAP-type C4-dicarboxylate transport system permease small subunit